MADHLRPDPRHDLTHMPDYDGAGHASDAGPSLAMRAEVRALAERNFAACMALGPDGNVGQLQLDQTDAIKRHIAPLPIAQGTAYLIMYAEELNALSARVEAETRATVARQTQESSGVTPLIQGTITLLILLAIGWCARPWG